MIRRFRISRQFLVDVPRTRPVSIQLSDGSVVQGMGHSTIDHPKFTEFRAKLAKLCFIQIDNSSVNNDRALKPFMVNGYRFNRGDKFPCGAALGIWTSIKK